MSQETLKKQKNAPLSVDKIAFFCCERTVKRCVNVGKNSKKVCDFALLTNSTNWNLFDSDYLPFFFAMCETMEQTIIPITNGIAKSSPTSQGALLPGAYRRTVQL